MDPDLIQLFEQHKQLSEEVKKQQLAMLEIRRQISMKLADGNYGVLVIPFFFKWDKWQQR